jgi:predicted ATP-dependent endonuclease of OLD family
MARYSRGAMRLSSIKIEKFKRFENLLIEGLSSSARLVVIAGPNGNGKSSLFDAFQFWRRGHGGGGWTWDSTYHARDGAVRAQTERVQLSFHSQTTIDSEAAASAIHIRTAYRNEANVQRLCSTFKLRRGAGLA